MPKIERLQDLDVWKLGIELVKGVYQATSKFPSSELYGLSAQMRRAAVSIPSNVAEGFRRRHPKEFRQYLNITRGSLGELETQTIIAIELAYLTRTDSEPLLEIIDHISRMVSNLLKCIHVKRPTPYAVRRTQQEVLP